MERGSTLFLRGVVLLIALGVAGVCGVLIPLILTSNDNVGGYTPILLGLYAAAVPFYIALYQTLKLLRYIDKHMAFSTAAIRTLQIIKRCAVSIFALFTLAMPYIYIVADRDDAPGVVLMGLIIAFASMVIAVFGGVLQKLLQNAADIKSENDLTV